MKSAAIARPVIFLAVFIAALAAIQFMAVAIWADEARTMPLLSLIATGLIATAIFEFILRKRSR